MKTIVCYGDSNTFGYNPNNGLRYDEFLIWPSVLQELLKDEYIVYNEGLNGRTTAYDRLEDGKNGLKELVSTLEKYNSIDILIFMLGTNDCCRDMNLSIDDISLGLEQLLITTKKYYQNKQRSLPKMMIIVPARILDDYEKSPFAWQLDENSIIKSSLLAKPYKMLADKYNCLYVDGTLLDVSKIDCEHLTKDGHRQLGNMVYETLRIVR